MDVFQIGQCSLPFRTRVVSVRLPSTPVPVPARPYDAAVERPLPPDVAAELGRIKARLNAAKTALDPIYARDQHQYSAISDRIEPYKPLRGVLKTRGLNNVTNAWLKMYEMYRYYEVGAGGAPLVHFDNAALPGAFIEAVNAASYPTPYEWWASSLVSTDTGILDDMYGLLRHNPTRWIMERDPASPYNGDITRVAFLRRMHEAMAPRRVNLYTSDAGISTAPGVHARLSFNDQEQLNMRINLGQVLSGLLVLGVGPQTTFVTKQYTFFEPFTVSLMTVAAQFFDEFYVSKPLTSKTTNSECYLVGRGFRGVSVEWRAYLEAALAVLTDVEPMPAALVELVALDLSKITEAAQAIHEVQADLVVNNERVYQAFRGRAPALKPLVRAFHDERTADWVARYRPAAVSRLLRSNANPGGSGGASASGGTDAPGHYPVDPHTELDRYSGGPVSDTF